MEVKVFIGDSRGNWDERLVTVDEATVKIYGLAAALLGKAEVPEGWKITGIVDPETGEEFTQF